MKTSVLPRGPLAYRPPSMSSTNSAMRRPTTQGHSWSVEESEAIRRAEREPHRLRGKPNPQLAADDERRNATDAVVRSSLHGVPSDTGGGTEVAGNAYARQAVTSPSLARTRRKPPTPPTSSLRPQQRRGAPLPRSASSTRRPAATCSRRAWRLTPSRASRTPRQ
jgi:hypothetical protein